MGPAGRGSLSNCSGIVTDTAVHSATGSVPPRICYAILPPDPYPAQHLLLVISFPGSHPDRSKKKKRKTSQRRLVCVNPDSTHDDKSHEALHLLELF